MSAGEPLAVARRQADVAPATLGDYLDALIDRVRGQLAGLGCTDVDAARRGVPRSSPWPVLAEGFLLLVRRRWK